MSDVSSPRPEPLVLLLAAFLSPFIAIAALAPVICRVTDLLFALVD